MKTVILYISLFFFCLISWSQEKVTGWKINSNPIYILDGKEINPLGFKKIDPNTIDTINVLKGENAKAIYAERGVNGVILLKSKVIDPTFLKLYAVNFTTNENKKVINLSGKIMDCEHTVLNNITITNLNTNEKNTNQTDGTFQLKCHKEDVISFKGVNTEEVRILALKKDLKLSITLKESDSIITNPTRPGAVIIKKPVIYLYPKQQTEVDLKINFNGNLLTTFPKYNNGWQVTAYPDGKIYDKTTKRFYNSLFWDGKRNFDTENTPTTGFLVEKEQLSSFLIEKLETIGLNTTETNDFIQFWLPILEANPYNFIHFKINEACDSISINEIKPQPDTLIRVMMEFHKSDKNHQVKEQNLKSNSRKGFTLVEWGGSEIPNNSKQNSL